MRIVVIGLGKVGRAMTAQLTAENNDIVVIDQNPDLIEDIVNIYDVRGVPGNGGENMSAELSSHTSSFCFNHNKL